MEAAYCHNKKCTHLLAYAYATWLDTTLARSRSSKSSLRGEASMDAEPARRSGQAMSGAQANIVSLSNSQSDRSTSLFLTSEQSMPSTQARGAFNSSANAKRELSPARLSSTGHTTKAISSTRSRSASSSNGRNSTASMPFAHASRALSPTRVNPNSLECTCGIVPPSHSSRSTLVGESIAAQCTCKVPWARTRVRQMEMNSAHNCVGMAGLNLHSGTCKEISSMSTVPKV